MPILPAEPDMFPEELLNPDVEESVGQEWFALYTLSRREKELMRRLRALGVPHYGPQIKKKSRSPSGRVRESYMPLFAGYVFLRGTQQHRLQALTTNCVARCIEVRDGARLERDLRQIRQLIATDAPLTPESRLEPGQRVRVRSGSMMGLEGQVVRRRGRDWLVVAVEFLQQGASVLLEDFQVEPL